MKGTGEAGTKRICPPFQFLADFKGRTFTTRTQTNIVSGAMIERAGIKIKKKCVICELMMTGYSTKWTA